MDIWGKPVPGRGNSTCEGSEVEGFLIPLRNSKKVSMPGDAGKCDRERGPRGSRGGRTKGSPYLSN